jgi:Coenzyme PQQ synthesis protein D (PqqD)
MPPAETYLAQSADIAARVLGDETIIMSTLDSTIFMLNPTGTVIWQAADGNTPLSRIIEEKVCAEFDVPVEQASEDARDFVEELAKHGILLVSDEPIPPLKEVP